MFKEMSPVMQYLTPLTKQELSSCMGDVSGVPTAQYQNLFLLTAPCQ